MAGSVYWFYSEEEEEEEEEEGDLYLLDQERPCRTW
jgi:hypothetical protein